MTRPCRECLIPFAPYRAAEYFCQPSCRQTWNNRRAMRGAELYDLFRALRRERRVATATNLWTDICRLEELWEAEDKRERPGRRSYVPMEEARQRLTDAGRISRRLTQAQVDADADKRRRVNAKKQAERQAEREMVA